MLRYLLPLALVLGSTLAVPPPFMDFQERFAEHSQAVEPQLQELRAENTQLRGDVLQVILEEIGNLTVEMRRITNETWDIIENHEITDDVCLVVMRELFDYYVLIGEWDIMYCAEDMIYFMDRDWNQRFNPRMKFMQSENTRATFQTIQTLGRNRFLAEVEDTLFELQDELDYYHNLWEGYQVVLREELEAIEPFEEMIRLEMQAWQTYAINWHKLFMEWAIEDMYYYCGDELEGKSAGEKIVQ